MRYRQLSPTGDYTFGNGQNNFYIDSPAAVAQAVLTTLKLIYGEWYLNTTEGVPYFTGILGYENQITADATIQNQILNVQAIISATTIPSGYQAGQLVPCVSGIENYQSTIDPYSRAYSASCILNTIYGPTQLEIANYPNF
jgi:hypothetical protein